jgi:NADPH:quinone reductase-like Zn-dependent oxidoreductase
MARAVQFDQYGDVNVLKVVEVPMPRPGPDGVLVEVRAAGINPLDSLIRSGVLEQMYPTSFPSGQGADFAGVVTAVGDQVKDFKPGDEVLGWCTDRSSLATHVAAPSSQVVRKPPQLPWDVAGALYMAGMAAWASVAAIEPRSGDVVVVSGATGGVGSIAVQLLRLRGATVIALASPGKHDWLIKRGAIPVEYGDRTKQRIRDAAPSGRLDAWVDAFGNGYVDMAIELGIPPEHINTIIDFAAAQKYRTKALGTQAAASAENLGKLAALVAEGKVEIPIAARYPLDDVREAFRELDKRRTHGKIVLVPRRTSK